MKKKQWPVQTTTIPIQWGEMDAFNHVNNVVYIRWCETARIELFRKIWGDRGINMKEILEGNGVGPILANFNVNYKIPISYPDNVIIQTRVAKIGNTSFNVELKNRRDRQWSKISQPAMRLGSFGSLAPRNAVA